MCYGTDLGLHYVVPTLFTFHWVLHAPTAGLRFAHVPAFGISPAAYVAYRMLRGAMIGKYPYCFVDASTIGFATAARNAAAILTFYCMVARLLMVIAALAEDIDNMMRVNVELAFFDREWPKTFH